MRYRKQRRGGKGVRDIRTSERNGPVVGVAAVRDERRHHAHHDRRHGQPHARPRDPRRRPQHAGRALMNLNEGDKLASLARVGAEARGGGGGGRAGKVATSGRIRC